MKRREHEARNRYLLLDECLWSWLLSVSVMTVHRLPSCINSFTRYSLIVPLTHTRAVRRRTVLWGVTDSFAKVDTVVRFSCGWSFTFCARRDGARRNSDIKVSLHYVARWRVCARRKQHPCCSFAFFSSDVGWAVQALRMWWLGSQKRPPSREYHTISIEEILK